MKTTIDRMVRYLTCGSGVPTNLVAFEFLVLEEFTVRSVSPDGTYDVVFPEGIHVPVLTCQTSTEENQPFVNGGYYRHSLPVGTVECDDPYEALDIYLKRIETSNPYRCMYSDVYPINIMHLRRPLLKIKEVEYEGARKGDRKVP